MTTVGEQKTQIDQNASASNDLTQDLAESSSIWIATAVLILVILGLLILFRFAPEIVNFVSSWLGFADPIEFEDVYEGESVVYRAFSIVILSLFIPCTAVSYYTARRRVRKRELEEVCEMLAINYDHYVGIYGRETKQVHFFFAVMFTFVITILGLTAVMLGAELNLNKGLNLLLRGSLNGGGNLGVDDVSHARYQQGSLLFFGLAFLGAYLWGLQEIIRRYFANDLVPGVYYTLGVRMIFAAILALLVYQMIGGFDAAGLGSAAQDSGVLEDIGGTVFPLLAFLIGIFPQRMLQYLTDKISIFARPEDTAGNEVPLELIQGISVNNRMRLREEGVDSCFDLAQSDFVRLLFTTPFPAKQLVDWILQAKLCVFFPDKLDDLRQNGVRSIEQLRQIDQDSEDTLAALASETKLTRSALERARRESEDDSAVDQLLAFRKRLDSMALIMPAEQPRTAREEPVTEPKVQSETEPKADWPQHTASLQRLPKKPH